jgi:hypothetical protein
MRTGCEQAMCRVKLYDQRAAPVAFIVTLTNCFLLWCDTLRLRYAERGKQKKKCKITAATELL